MKVAIVANDSPHQVAIAQAMLAGLKRHGVAAKIVGPHDMGGDVVCAWGWRKAQIYKGRSTLVMELGYVGDRLNKWFSLGWDGLNGMARFPTGDGSRWQKHFPDVLQPWRVSNGRLALLCAQMQGDASLDGLDVKKWAQITTDQLIAAQWHVAYRPHPNDSQNWLPAGAARAFGTSIEKALSAADLCVTYSSNSGVDAVLAGVPTVTMHQMSMAWPVTTHTVAEEPIRPDRTEWANNLAWSQWTLDEIASGEAWAALTPVIKTY